MARGDHIFISSTAGCVPFQHHGIDMADGTVIHLAPASGGRIALRDDSAEFAVRRDTYDDFCRGQVPTRVDHDDARDSELIASTAQQHLGRTGYSLFENNCEHFATMCAMGRAESYQIEMGEATVSSMASLATKALGTVSTRVGARLALRSTVKVHPAVMLADGVEMATLAIGCRNGLTARRSRRIARFTGTLAAAGIGGILGGPAGAAVCVATHTSSTAIADQLCKRIRAMLR